MRRSNPYTVKTAVMNPLQTNCFILIADSKGIIFDPSADNGNNVDRILKKCEGIDIEAIVLTHGHIDHISGVEPLLEHFEVPVYIHQTEVEYLLNNNLNLASQVQPDFTWNTKTEPLDEGQVKIGSFEFNVVLTPGHTPGSVSLFYQDAVFSGDVLFKMSMGRTDLPGGSNQQMRQTLDYFLNLEEDYTVYCGHGEITQLSFEQKYNPYLRGIY